MDSERERAHQAFLNKIDLLQTYETKTDHAKSVLENFGSENVVSNDAIEISQSKSAKKLIEMDVQADTQEKELKHLKVVNQALDRQK